MDRYGFKCPHLPHHAFFGATHARRADPDRPHARNFIEVPRRTGRVSYRSLAAEFVQAISLAMSFVAERRGESSCIKVSAPRAAFVDDAVVGEFRTAELIQFRQATHGDVFQNHGQQVLGIGRAARKIDDWFSRNHGIDADRARGIGIGGRNSAPGCARAYGDHGRSLRGHLFDDLNGGLSAELHVDAVVAGGNEPSTTRMYFPALSSMAERRAASAWAPEAAISVS